MDPILERYHALEAKVLSYTPTLDTKLLFEAFTYADAAHHGQLRKSGEPYIIHPLAVAEIVAELDLDVDSVLAALLHDCIEDTESTHEEIAKRFGPTVAELVEGVTKLTRVQYITKEEEQMENLRSSRCATVCTTCVPWNICPPKSSGRSLWRPWRSTPPSPTASVCRS